MMLPSRPLGLGISPTYSSQIAALQPVYCPSCPPSLVTALVNMESGGNQYTNSGSVLTSSKGAEGLFQLMPATAAGLNVDPTIPAQNIQGGLTLLQQLYNQYGDWTEALEAYNEGGGALAAQLAAGQTPVSAGYASSILSAAGISDSSSSSSSDSSITGDSSDSLDAGDDTDASLFGGLSGTTWALAGVALIGLAYAFRR